MNEAVVVSTARTGLAKSWRGSLNMTYGATIGGHVVKHTIERAKLDPGEVEDVLMGGHLRSRRRGVHLLRAERSESAHGARALAAGEKAGDLLVHAPDSGACLPALQHLARKTG